MGDQNGLDGTDVGRKESSPTRRLRVYCRGLNNYQYYGSILPVELWSMVPQMDFKMILVII